MTSTPLPSDPALTALVLDNVDRAVIALSADGRVALFNPATGKGDRVGFRVLDDGRKVRFFKSNGELLGA